MFVTADFRSFYFVREDDFEELDAFVREGDSRYALRMQFLTNQEFKRGLVDFISETGTQVGVGVRV
jgi:FAD synthetase